MRARWLTLLISAACTAASGLAFGQDDEDHGPFGAMLGLVIAHDIAIIVGLSPTPLIQYGGESVEFAANLGLKALRPWLEAPPDVSVDPGVPPPTNSTYTVTPDGCGVEFRLLSAQAEYENMFGVANFRPAYVDPANDKRYPWHADDPLATRWGFLQAPTVYHANSTVKVSVGAREQVRRYDSETGTFSEPFDPILSTKEEPQTAYLPIGHHIIDWRAGTQLSWISDVAAPALLLAIGVMTEVIKAHGGLSVAKDVKKVGISDAVINEALDPQGAARLSEGVKRYNAIWQKAWKAGQDKKWMRELKKNVGCKVVSVIVELLDKVYDNQVTVLEENTPDDLYKAGRITRLEARLLEAIFWTWTERGLDLGVLAIQAATTCDDPDETVVAVIEFLLEEGGEEHSWVEDLLTKETKVSREQQIVTVLDGTPPTIAIPSEPLVVEATDFGGTRLQRARPMMLAAAEAGAADNCGRTPELLLIAPDVLPLGLNEVTWVARDRGPNPPNDTRDFAPTAVQRILVQDTQPPLLLAPPSKVIEAAGAVPLGSAGIGDAAAVDLVDVQPAVVNDAPASFPLDRRTRIEWRATDQSGNFATATQQITVKTVGTNTPPVANTATARTLTADPVDIRLTALDVDVLDDVVDPLWFKIESQPLHGEFVAPLYPFFIEDYRTRPGDGLGDDFDPVTDDVHNFVSDTYCDQSPILEPPRNFVHEPLFVHVTDEGIRYVLDEFFDCGDEGNAHTFGRFSKWSAAGEFLGEAVLGANQEERPRNDAFVIDRDGFLYYYVATESESSSNEVRLVRCTTDWSGSTYANQICLKSYKFDGGSAPDSRLDARSLRVVRVDSATNIAYVADARRVFAFELLDSGDVRYLDEVGPKSGGAVIEGWVGQPQAIEVGADGSVYVADVLHHRIHKIGGARRDEDQAVVLGDYVGWAGRCTGSGNKACDDTLGRSRGYSCTFEATSCTVAPANRSGSAQGQFNTPSYIAIDPNDILYVADYENARVQRLSADGSFAGEAVSDGSGVNKGDRPSFVVGNMGRPESVSVNSSQFYVVDRDEDFVHVFGTLPFKDIADDAVTVTYVSDQNFPNPNITGIDAFTYSVTDGLARSTPATVTINVDRNFRAPTAIDGAVVTDEDVQIEVTLEADDPDGIAGKDFLGLDTLTYTVTSLPQNGELTGGGDNWTYRPSAGFYGDDRFTFKVNDGRDDSNEATVAIEVTPRNDPPEVTIEEPARVPLGFPILLTANFLDDPAAAYEARVTWGDNTTSVTGEITDGETSDPEIAGVFVTDPPAPGIEGQAFAQHVYEAAGARTVTVCLTDDGGLEGCDTVQVLVEPLVRLGFGGIVYDEPLVEDEVTDQEVLDGVPFTYEVTVLNGLPSVGEGLTAAGIVLDAELPSALTVVDVAITQGECTVTGIDVSCSIGDLPPDASATLAVRAHGPGTVSAATAHDFSGVLSTVSDAVESEVEFVVSVDVLPNLADGDGDGIPEGYERAYGLDWARDDGGEDADSDGLSNHAEFALGTSPQAADTDGDGLTDFIEYQAGTSDPTRADTDADGMPDGWEIQHGLGPMLAADADRDADGDGLANRDEFAQGKDPRRDDMAPIIALPPDITVVATGRLTRVPLGAGSARDGRDGAVGAHASTTGPFVPGANVVSWSATDTAGNRAVGVQRVNVIPLATFAVDQSVEEGGVARVLVELNGAAASYPVVIPYSVTGTAANPEDHATASGVLTIGSGIGGSIDVPTVLDALTDDDETVVLTMGTPTNAAPGVKTVHTITISEGNVPPRVSVRVEQQGRAATTVVRDGGGIAVAADVQDDAGRSHRYDWSGSDPGAFNPTQVTAASYVLDALALTAGVYALEVDVADDAVPVARGAARTLFRVVNALPILNVADDSDGDGVDDRTEGAGDTDDDRVPDYLDAPSNTNWLALADDGRGLEVSTGLALRLGERSFALGAGNPGLVEDDVAADVAHGYPNGVVDFEVTGLEPGGRANVVLPLLHPIAAGAVYRKLLFGVWQDFSATGADSLASAPGADGVCPPPGSAAYRPALTVGDGCLQLTLTDGGPNDADGFANGVIRDPGGLAMPVAVTLEVVPVATTLAAAGPDVVMLKLALHSDSGDALLRSLTLDADGTGDDRGIDEVFLVHDVDADGVPDADDPVLASGGYEANDGSLTLTLASELEVPFGITNVLVVYRTEAESR